MVRAERAKVWRVWVTNLEGEKTGCKEKGMARVTELEDKGYRERQMRGLGL